MTVALIGRSSIPQATVRKQMPTSTANADIIQLNYAVIELWRGCVFTYPYMLNMVNDGC
jgi:hypothetical protein